MTEQVGDFLLKRLREWGIHRIYGYPGDGINAILGAFNRAESDPELIQVRHEEMAAFMACAHAKFTGEVGVCLATSGPGRDPSPERAVRREARPSAGRRDRRAAGAVRARRLLSAGGRSDDAVQGRRARVRRDGVLAGADPPSGRSRGPDREGSAHGHLPDHPERRRGDGGGRDAAARARDDPLGVGYSPPTIVPSRGRPAHAPPRC